MEFGWLCHLILFKTEVCSMYKNSNTCVCCGDEIPEGTMVCVNCESGTWRMYKKMHSIHSIVFPSLNSNPDGISADLFFNGCKIHCKGCHNKELQDFKEANTSTSEILDCLLSNNVKIVTLMGGEPLDRSIDDLCYLVNSIKAHGIKVSLFTGYCTSEIPSKLFKLLDYVKVGKFDCIHLNPVGSFLSSHNQHFYKVLNKRGDDLVLREYGSDGHYVDTINVLSLNR